MFFSGLLSESVKNTFFDLIKKFKGPHMRMCPVGLVNSV